MVRAGPQSQYFLLSSGRRRKQITEDWWGRWGRSDLRSRRPSTKWRKYQARLLQIWFIISVCPYWVLTWLIVLMFYALLTPLNSHPTLGNLHDGPRRHWEAWEERGDGETARNGEGIKGWEQISLDCCLSINIGHSGYQYSSSVSTQQTETFLILVILIKLLPCTLHWLISVKMSNFYLFLAPGKVWVHDWPGKN